MSARRTPKWASRPTGKVSIPVVRKRVTRFERQLGAYNNALKAPIDAQDGGVARSPSAQAKNHLTAIRSLIAVRKQPLSQCHLRATELQ